MDKAGFNSCFEISPKPFLKTFLELNETIPAVLYLGRENLGNWWWQMVSQYFYLLSVISTNTLKTSRDVRIGILILGVFIN